MSKKSVIPIRPIDFDITKRAVDEFAHERNVPSTSYPRDDRPSREGEGRQPALPAKPQRSPCTKFTVELPDYLLDAVMRQAMNQKPRATAKYVILQALKSAGFTVADEDLLPDARRT